jgi:hypothetical protein
LIDAVTFAVSYGAFWNTYTPMCEHFVRRLNLDGYDRFSPPMDRSNTARRRALIAEYAFSLFVERKKVAWQSFSRSAEERIEAAAWHETEVRLRSYVSQGLDLKSKWSEEERAETRVLAQRLTRFFDDHTRRLVLRPVFCGCGFIDASEADLIYGETIFEIKTVERAFRSQDVRQVITYAALNTALEQYKFKKAGLLNPRHGVYYEEDLEYICAQISGRSSADLFALILDAVSSGEISR